MFALKTAKIIVFTLVFAFLALSVANAKVALDPSVVGVGARVLGMGRAYSAVSAGPDSLYLNPAALSQLTHWGMTSMYSKLIGEVDYFMLGGVRPLGNDTVGIGFLGASVGGIRTAVRDPITGRITFEAGTTNYYNNIYYLSYGRNIREDLSAGVNLKLYSQGFASGDSGTGYDADLGIVYKLRDNITLGFLQRNFVPAAAGGKVAWSDGHEEALATSSRLGVNYSGGFYNFSVDYELYPTQSDKSGLLKLGAEWWPTPTLALRAGSDQDQAETNLTAGLALLFRGFEFDYAYHQYGTLDQNTTHTFSLSYGIFGKEEEEIVKDIVKITKPQDKAVLFKEITEVEGIVLPEVQRLEVEGREVPFENGAFRFEQPLVLGRNNIVLQPYDRRGDALEQEVVRVLRLQEFSDVPEGYWVRVPISVFAMLKIVGGYPDGTFRPEGNITRAEMCTVLMKIRGKSGEKRATIFPDVPSSHWASGYISEAVGEGIVKGYPDGNFRPNGLITRAEGVVIISRFAGLPEPKELEAPFADVPGRHWAAKDIKSAKEAGLLQYMGERFDLNRKLTRAEAVEILSRTELLTPRINEVLDFEGG